ncbi:MAG: hypothetical protein WCI74_02055 [Actinomycetes bacterium]
MVFRRVFAALPVGVAIVLGVGACTSQGNDPGPSTASPTVATTSASASASASSTNAGPSPSPTRREFRLAAGSSLNMAGLPAPLPASAGTLSTESLGDSTQVTAIATEPATKKVPAKVAWTVSIEISSTGRAVAGTVTIDAQNWQVVPGTGVFVQTVDAKAASISTLRAFTVNHGDRSSNTPVTLVLVGAP